MSSSELKAEANRVSKIIYDNDVKKLGILLNSPHFSVNHLLLVLKQPDVHGNAPLHLAAILGNYQVFQCLLPIIINCTETPILSPSEVHLEKVIAETRHRQKSGSGSPASRSGQSTKTGSSGLSTNSSTSPENDSDSSNPLLTNYLFYLRETYMLLFIKRNKNQWTAFDEAVARGHRQTIAFFLKLINIYQVIISIQHSKTMKKATKEKLLQHDFKIHMKFDLSSWIPLLSRFLPQDNITLFHHKNNFRLDFHIVPGGGDTGAMLWAKGSYSIIFNSTDKTAIFLNHDKKEGQWIVTPDSGRRDRANSQQTASPGGIKVDNADLTLKEILSSKTAINSWICDPEESREPPLSLLHLLHIQNDEIIKQTNLVMAKPVQRPGLSTHNTVFTASSKNFFGLVGPGKTSTFGNFKANNYQIQGLELVVRSRNEHLSKDDKDRHEQMKSMTNNFKNGATSGAGNKLESKPTNQLQAPGMDLFEPLPTRQSQVALGNTEAQTSPELTEEEFKTQMDDMENLLNECTQQFKPSIAIEPGYTKPSFEEYLTMLHPIKVQLGHGRRINSKIKRHPVKGKISLCEDFPIQKSSLLNIIAAAAPKFRHFERLKEFMDMKMPEGFPVHVDCPIMATVSGQLTLLDLKIFKYPNVASEVDPKLFTVPKNFVVKKESSV